MLGPLSEVPWIPIRGKSLRLSYFLSNVIEKVHPSFVVYCYSVSGHCNIPTYKYTHMQCIYPFIYFYCPGEGNGNPLQYSCLENPKDRGTWWATVQGVTESETWLKWLSMHSTSFDRVWAVRCQPKCQPRWPRHPRRWFAPWGAQAGLQVSTQMRALGSITSHAYCELFPKLSILICKMGQNK